MNTMPSADDIVPFSNDGKTPYTLQSFGWQPIETAPKDGTIIDLWATHRAGSASRFTDALWKTKWGPHDSDYVGWAAQDEDGSRIHLDAGGWTVTHWMPLPAPPA